MLFHCPAGRVWAPLEGGRERGVCPPHQAERGGLCHPVTTQKVPQLLESAAQCRESLARDSQSPVSSLGAQQGGSLSRICLGTLQQLTNWYPYEFSPMYQLIGRGPVPQHQQMVGPIFTGKFSRHWSAEI